MKICILKETREPKDNRVPLTPSQCAILKEENPEIEVFVQSCNFRCYSDDEYRYHGIEVKNELADCDVLLGVKEIPPALLVPDKTYFIFSHTIKKQPHNRGLLRAALDKNIRLIDWETLTDTKGKRLIAFGRWAGIVGAYHAIRMIGLKYGIFNIRQMNECHNFAEAEKEFGRVKLPSLKIVLTGTGRVSQGSAFLLNLLGIRKVTPHDFCYQQFAEAVYTQLTSADMFYKEGQDHFNAADYHQHPQQYKSAFYPFTKVADVMINGIYWDKRMPCFFTAEQMRESDFTIKIIADITCDIAPNASVPSTLRPSGIAAPYFGYDAATGTEVKPFEQNSIDVMAIDNLPNELPRDASEDFGNMLMSRIIPELKRGQSDILDRATIAQNGALNTPYLYLADYAAGG
ncbi:MAG TPA: NAD(P)-dependent oxidoreductase [Chitinophagales bacterium]|nr:NAD(P)-dependent oxidoreductase [Chitinophagales bacterium]